ncbi:xanthine dehydrogenase family protein molybdopterin-binding subunit [Aquabacterium sp. J223]|uniref:xanthine dehydrogenase family protein molybdopterin-binding subunit n=1 Tax=Aquabacterium sp. J223 TaxID=2898431 RepID=UPI0021ADD476|nr:xanthine dehydrogenase family protein molybdopterin-binding subunit [Aquabacterium sp. J223]UUX95593.1 xanthine dehydrogenase family protein molybdopterin-binding subunit [Aquabacterium sp. J223]
MSTTTTGTPGIDDSTRFGSGQPVARIEDKALVRGEGRYTDDHVLPGQAFLAFARSPYAHARVLGVDAASAQDLPGVIAVFTGADLVAAGVKPMVNGAPFRRPDGGPLASPARHPLAHEVVRYVGEAVAAVVAETAEQARNAAALLMVDYEELPAVVDTRQALASGAPALCPDAPDNIAAEMRHGDPAAAQAAFDAAALTVKLDIVNQRLAPSPMEPRSTLAWLDNGRLTLRASSQMPTALRDAVVGHLPGLKTEDVRVVVGDVGGGFGMKGGAYPEDLVIAHAARTVGRPVKWQAQRLEDFVSAAHGRDVEGSAELALDADGKVLALRVHSLANVGAYGTATGMAIQMLVGPWVSTSVYDIRTIDLRFTSVLSNRAPTGAYRGAGRPEAIYLIERLMDEAARRLQLDPAELRRRNLVRPEQMPYTNAMKMTYDVGRFEQILDQGLALAEWNGFEARRAASAARGRLRGRAVSTFLEWTSGNAFEERVDVRVAADGFIELTSATMPMGQGIATSYAQLAVDVFGVPIERIRILQGDTDRANGFGSAGSRSLYIGGSALKVAAERTVEHAKGLAGEALEAPPADIEYRAGRFTVAGTDLGIDLFELAARQPGAQFTMDATTKVTGPSWPNACHAGEVEIDPATGVVELVAYASVNDIGYVVNPTIVKGQIEGGAVQGIGQALCEQMVYDEGSGQLNTASFLDYAMPRVDGFRDFKTAFDTSVPSVTNPLGVKGVGELGTIGATPTVVNAVIDALAREGRAEAASRLQMPLTPEKVWSALRASA